MTEPKTVPERISLGDIEGQLRSLGGSAHAVVSESKTTASAAAAVGGVLAVALVYLLGRRRGRRRATVLEIRRV
jgi:membrane protein DedA with SNARE-associated domain